MGACSRAYFAKQEFELVPDGLALNVSPCHQEVDDGRLISAWVRMRRSETELKLWAGSIKDLLLPHLPFPWTPSLNFPHPVLLITLPNNAPLPPPVLSFCLLPSPLPPPTESFHGLPEHLSVSLGVVGSRSLDGPMPHLLVNRHGCHLRGHL